MAWEHKPGHGSLFKNDKRKDSHPDLRGDGMCPLCEQLIEFAAWKKRTQKGDVFLSLSMQKPREREDREGSSESDTVGDIC